MRASPAGTGAVVETADLASVFELLRYCTRRVGPQLAEDVVAETFLIAYERRDRYDPVHWRQVVFRQAYRAEWQPLLLPGQRAALIRMLADLDVSVARFRLGDRDLVAVRLDELGYEQPELLFDAATGWRAGTQISVSASSAIPQPVPGEQFVEGATPVADCPLEPWIAERTLNTFGVVEEPGQVP